MVVSLSYECLVAIFCAARWDYERKGETTGKEDRETLGNLIAFIGKLEVPPQVLQEEYNKFKFNKVSLYDSFSIGGTALTLEDDDGSF